MPTGYTAPLHDGEEISFEQFTLRCSRAMGAAIMQRDESADVEIREIEIEDYYAANVTKAERKLAEAIHRSHADWEAMQAGEIEEATKYRDEYVAKRDAMAKRYKDMLDAVMAWEPPTSEHDGLKKFMIDQLTESIRFDCGDYTPSVPVEKTVVDYRSAKIDELVRSYTLAAERLAKQEERVRTQNAWVRDLRESLKDHA